MTPVVVLGMCAGLGLVGVGAGLRRTRPSLESVLASLERPPGLGRVTPPGIRTGPVGVTVGRAVAAQVLEGRWSTSSWVASILADLDVAGVDPAAFATRLVVVAGAGALGPFVLWLAVAAVGLAPPAGIALLGAVVAVPSGEVLSVTGLARRARERRRHVVVVTSSFVDLVVLGLAGGVGIDGALHAAAQVSPDWASRRIGTALAAAREGGTTPWAALEELGRRLRVPQLVELATTVQLAGTEGARVRQALAARATSLRRHEQADAESAANAMTERLFLPGALLLVGFLLFVGYPAVHRILGGLG